MKLLKSGLTAAFQYVWSKSDRFADQITAELSQNRTLLVWIYSAAFLALVFYTAVDNPDSHNTAIMTLGGIVATCFTSWVVAGSYESIKKNQAPVVPEDRDEAPELAEDEKNAAD